LRICFSWQVSCGIGSRLLCDTGICWSFRSCGRPAPSTLYAEFTVHFVHNFYCPDRKVLHVCIGWITRLLWFGVTLLLRIAWGLTLRSAITEDVTAFPICVTLFPHFVSVYIFCEFSLLKSINLIDFVTIFACDPIGFVILCYRISNPYWQVQIQGFSMLL
jgi:hypothetical protein